MRPREAKQPAPAHIGSKGQSQDSNPGSLGKEFMLLTTKPTATHFSSIIYFLSDKIYSSCIPYLKIK